MNTGVTFLRQNNTLYVHNISFLRNMFTSAHIGMSLIYLPLYLLVFKSRINCGIAKILHPSVIAAFLNVLMNEFGLLSYVIILRNFHLSVRKFTFL